MQQNPSLCEVSLKVMESTDKGSDSGGVANDDLEDDKSKDRIEVEVAKWTRHQCKNCKANHMRTYQRVWLDDARIPKPPKASLEALLDEKKDETKEEGQDCVIDGYRNGASGDESLCLSDWWFNVQELRLYPNVSVGQLKKEPRSLIYQYLQKAEFFREKFGDSAVPTIERIQRRTHEHVIGVPFLEYETKYDRKRVHDPLLPQRYNKRRRLEEHFEDYDSSWISKHDEKPCGCRKCKPCLKCGAVN